jgi:NAD(P)H-dependent flavin oxidoreductase YrpB (nitropropane dioxygenase family)
VCHQVGSIAAAQEAARAGVDVIIAQGVEAEATWLGKLRPWR